ncbi:Fis family transcriptional regulator [Caldichromatium japonicum]|uniref:Putative Fis-like DNA-binding protein n=1 Tax=Caldichromatium japonicum TaxID=2699430 RepID=A0A6G7VFZ5_9GAMM|nr:helix-turn-helix domain-containing protein [Caldichromatium japonicum]QIK38830.1 Fis family transcriptional regulator [Caldichromatium japonicum]
MKRTALTTSSIPAAANSLAASQPLAECVRLAIETYLAQMGDYAVEGLYDLVIREVERPLFEAVLRHSRGNLTQAARMLGLNRNTLRKRLAAHGIIRE